MSQIDLKDLRLGDLVEYQHAAPLHRSLGTFQSWYSAADGQVSAIVRSLR